MSFQMWFQSGLLLLVLIVPKICCVPSQIFLETLENGKGSSAIGFANALISYLPTWMENVHRFEVTIETQDNNDVTRDFFMQQTNQFLSNLSIFSHKLSVNQPQMRSEIRHVILLDNISSFVKIFEHIKYGKHGGKFLIVLQGNPFPSNYNLMRKIFKAMNSIKLVQAIVLVQEETEAIDVYTYYPFTAYSCQSMEPLRINRFKRGSFEREWKIRKCLNFFNCTLKVFPVLIKPYVTVTDETDDNNQTTTKIGGFEGKILDTIAEKLNFSVHALMAYRCPWAISNGIRNGTAIFIMLQKGDVDIRMGYAFYNPESIIEYGATSSYYSTNMVAVIKKDCIRSPRFYWFLQPFQPVTWLVIGAVFGSGLVLCLCQSPFGKKLIYCLEYIALVLGLSETKFFNSKKLRFNALIVSLCLIILRAAYSGKIYDTYSFNRYEKPPSTLTDLFLRNYTIRGFIKFTEPVTKKTIFPHQIPFTNRSLAKELDESSCSDKLAIFLNFGMVVNYTSYHKRTGAFMVIPDPVKVQQFCAYFHKNHCAVTEFNRIISGLLSSGIIGQWLKEFRLDINQESQFSSSDIQAPEPKPLTFEELMLIFFLLKVLLIFATLVFLGELLYAYFKAVELKGYDA